MSSSIWFIDRTLLRATTPGNEMVLHIPQSSSITRASLTDCLVSYPGHSLRVGIALCRDADGVFYSSNRLSRSCSSLAVNKWQMKYFYGIFTWERRQWKDTPHSQKLEHYRSLTIRLFSVISRTLVGDGLSPM